MASFIEFLLGSPKNNKSNTAQNDKKKKEYSTQNALPYEACYDNGLFYLGNGEYSKTYPITDINFKIASQEDQDSVFLKFGDLLNMFDNKARAEITVFNKTVAKEEFNEKVMINPVGDGLDDLREEYNRIIIEKANEGGNNLQKEVYITVTIKAENVEAANQIFSRLDPAVSSQIKRITGEDTFPLDAVHRLSLIQETYRSENDLSITKNAIVHGEELKGYDSKKLESMGITSKDVIAPAFCSFGERDHFVMGEKYGQSMFLQNIQSFLSTDFMSDLSDNPFNLMISVHYEPLQQDRAIKLIRNHIVNIDADVMNKQKRATKAGYSPDLISPTLLKSKNDSDKILADITSRNQKLFFVTFVITHFADDLETLKKQGDTIKMIAQKYLVSVNTLLYQQSYGYEASLPVGGNRLSVKRLLTTEQASVFIPFSTQELSQSTGFYYGLNAVSHNLLLYDRRKSKNANGIILGTPGSGKSFSAKREILNVLLSTDDDVFIIDPEREYAPLAKLLGGEIIRVAAGSKVYINPLDMDVEYAGDDDPVTLKSDFICSLCETICGGKYGFSESQKAIIDRCVRMVYDPYLEYMRTHPNTTTCDVSIMPTLKNLYELILMQDEPEAKHIALSLERFVTGSLDIFAHRTNVNTNKRFVVYDIKDIGSGLKELGLQVCLNDIWNRTITNKAKKKRTWFYIDEFYLLTQTPSSAMFLQEIFKRARKWGGVPTGITQNVEDMLASKEARTMISNCDFVMMLNQSPMDKIELAKMFNISQTELSYVTGADVGEGLLYVGKIVPFIDKYPQDTKTYKYMSTKMEDII